MASAFDQDSFRGRLDSVGIGLNSATFTNALNTDWTQDSDTTFRIRFLIQETGTGTTADVTFTLYYSHNGGGYLQVDEDQLVYVTKSTNYTNGATTTQVIGAGSYITGDSAGGVEGEYVTDTGLVDVVINKEFEVEFCLSIQGRSVSEGDTIDFRVRRGNTSVLASYTRTPRVTVHILPPPDANAFLGDVVWRITSFNDLTTTGGWVDAAPVYFHTGNINSHPSTHQPALVRFVGNSLRMKALGVIGPGLFPPGASDTITKTITGLAAGTYVYEYYQVSHDEGVRTTRLLSGAGQAVVMDLTDGDEAAGSTTWVHFHHPFVHVGGDLVLEVYYQTAALPTSNPANTGIKDSAILIRTYVSIGTIGLTAGASADTPPPPGQRPVTLPARSLSMTLEER